MNVSLLWGLLDIQEHPRVGPTGCAFVAQVKLVASFAGMIPYITSPLSMKACLTQASYWELIMR